MDVTTSVTTVVLLLAANGFFVAAEYALVKARDMPIASLAGAGSAAVRLTLRIQGDLEAYLATCRLGITMASLGLGWTGASVAVGLLEPLFHALGLPDAVLGTSAFAVGFLILCALHIVIGQQVPKTLAIRRPEPVTLWVAYPLHWAHLALWAPNRLLNRANRGALSLFGVGEDRQGDLPSGEAPTGRVKTPDGQGEMAHHKAEMLRKRFEHDQRPISRVMVPRNQVHTLDLACDPWQNLFLMCDTAHTRFPVVDGANEGRIVGILYASDVFNITVDNVRLTREDTPWKSLRRFCRDPLVVHKTQLVSELFASLHLEPLRMALVVDEHGALAGIVTLEDLLDEHRCERTAFERLETPQSDAAEKDAQADRNRPTEE